MSDSITARTTYKYHLYWCDRREQPGIGPIRTEHSQVSTLKRSIVSLELKSSPL